MKLASIFTDHMVLQRQKPIRIWGEAEGEVAVTFLGRTVLAAPTPTDIGWQFFRQQKPEVLLK